MALRNLAEKTARVLAIIGGVVLVIITLTTIVSIIGRGLIFAGLGPVPGDFELVEAGVGFAVFAFLPWCHINRGHATVDLFTNFLSERVNRWIDLVTEIIMSVVMTVIAWKQIEGTLDKMQYGETTFILQFPVWWPYAASSVAAVFACLIAYYMLAVRIREVATGKTEFAQVMGAHH